MKHKSHIVKVYVYNPDNLKEVIDIKEFIIKYIPTKKWNEYLILVNNEYCGEKMTLTSIIQNNTEGINSPRFLIGKSISNYVNNNTYPYQNRVKVTYPHDDCINMTNVAFNKYILPVNSFKNKDELTKLNLFL